jgi:hypothetical protein
MMPTAIRSDRFSRHCEARSAAAIQGRKHGALGRWIATSKERLAMTGKAVRAAGRWY